MSGGPRAVPLELSEAERAELRRLLRRRGVGQASAHLGKRLNRVGLD